MREVDRIKGKVDEVRKEVSVRPSVTLKVIMGGKKFFYIMIGKVKSERGESDVVLRRHSRKELLTRKDETGSRWRVYFVQLLNGGELREIGDCEGSGNEREKE